MRKFLETVTEPCINCVLAICGIEDNSDKIPDTVRLVARGCQLDECRLPEEVRPHIPCEKMENRTILFQGKEIDGRNMGGKYPCGIGISELQVQGNEGSK